MSLFTTDDYLRALQALISSGRAWTRDPKAVQAAVLRTLGASFQRSDNDAQALLRGAFPKTATIMLTEREKTLGLPDDCSIGEVDTIAKRQNAIVSKLISTGGQSKSYFISIAAAMGYVISIKEYRQARADLAIVATRSVLGETVSLSVVLLHWRHPIHW
ncbi:putative phage tail protein [Klebsiella aerogenes]|uniref:putative phage tail protein n=1 Tax=Klebsiella aerogenes TaxID=548 RepID=UPI003AB69763